MKIRMVWLQTSRVKTVISDDVFTFPYKEKAVFFLRHAKQLQEIQVKPRVPRIDLPAEEYANVRATCRRCMGNCQEKKRLVNKELERLICMYEINSVQTLSGELRCCLCSQIPIFKKDDFSPG
ncbi:hypothetical protein D918_07055 [Trichuris suis]|nr:hypothetical protein D918_07055 [Trichuris suis]